ncbi:hypothetical protein GCM10023238_29880 [Streptomyces heliomycini]
MWVPRSDGPGRWALVTARVVWTVRGRIGPSHAGSVSANLRAGHIAGAPALVERTPAQACAEQP